MLPKSSQHRDKDKMSVALYNQGIVEPISQRSEILKRIHIGYLGILLLLLLLLLLLTLLEPINTRGQIRSCFTEVKVILRLTHIIRIRLK